MSYKIFKFCFFIDNTIVILHNDGKNIVHNFT